MKSLNKNLITGASFILAIILIYFGINYLKGVNIFKKQNNYIVVFKDVRGLNVSSPIYINGYQIGLVNSINIANSSPILIAVDVHLDKDFKIPKGSRMLFEYDFLGGSSVNLIINKNSREYMTPGDTIIGEQKIGVMSRMAGAVPKAESILNSVDSVIISLNNILSSQVLRRGIDDLGSALTILDETSKNIKVLTAGLKNNVPAIAQNLNKASYHVNSLTNKLDSIDINKTFGSIDEITSNLKQLSEKLNSQDNTIGLLTNGTALHDSLIYTVHSATTLLEDIKQNPKKYLTVKVKLF